MMLNAVFPGTCTRWGTFLAVVTALSLAAQSSAQAAGPNTFDCESAKFDLVIDAGPNHGVSVTSSGGQTRIVPIAADAVVGIDDLARITSGEIFIDAGSSTKGILVRNVTVTPPQTARRMRLRSAGEVVLGGAFVLMPSQELAIKATGLEAIDCATIFGIGNGAHIVGGMLRLNIGAAGIGTSSSPHGQVTTLQARSLSLKTVAGARVCLNMAQGGNTDTIQLGPLILGGQTGIRLESAPVFSTAGVTVAPGGSLLIGPNASLCY